MCNIPLIESKHFDLWLDTEDIGIEIMYSVGLKTLFIKLLVFEISISKNNEVENG